MTSIELKQRPIKSSIQNTGEPSAKSNGLQVDSPVYSRILAARGIDEASQLDYALKHLLPPSGLSNIDEAAHLLADAITADASVLIVGDFDADGATSCALAIKCLKAFGLNKVDYLVPNRFEFGYGLSPEIVGVAAMKQPDVIVTVDNGISSVDGVYAAQQLGMSVLVTDHHLPGDQIPTAEVIVNPNLPNDRFASKNLAGVGVIFYVMLALRAHLRKIGWFRETNIAEPNMSTFLDLVALGTVADVVRLDQNNRILVQQGLDRIRAGKACFGIQALLNVAKRNASRISSSDLGFAVGPRLNAAGRLDDMSVGIECLLADNQSRAFELANQLDLLNLERREVEQTMQEDALAVVDKLGSELVDESAPAIYALYDESWHQGIVGLVASRIKDKVHRPVLVLAPSDASSSMDVGDVNTSEREWKGSMRSVDGVHIRDLLARLDALHPNLMIKFGGHAMAAGLSVYENKLGELIQALQVVAEEFTKGKDWNQTIWTDGELDPHDFTQQFADQLRFGMPWGQGFPEPLFEGDFEVLESRVVGDIHAKLTLKIPQNEQTIDAIFFGYLRDNNALPSGLIRAAYRLDINEFRNNITLQLILQHIV